MVAFDLIVKYYEDVIYKWKNIDQILFIHFFLLFPFSFLTAETYNFSSSNTFYLFMLFSRAFNYLGIACNSVNNFE